MSKSLKIDYSENILLALNLTHEEFSKEARVLIAVKLYELGRLSTGAAAEFARVPKPIFLTKLAEYGIDTFSISEEELQNDLLSATSYL